MDLLKHKFLWLPALGLAALFLLDKVFFLPAVTDHTVHWQKIEPAFYESRRLLFEQLKEEYPERKARGEKLGLILGTSRAGEFEPEIFTDLVPGSYTYNFSAPFSSPVFYSYWLTRMQEAGIEPAFVIFESDPVVLTETAMEFTMQYSLDWRFVWNHTELFRRLPPNPWQAEGAGFSYDQAESFASTALFGLHKYPIKLDSIVANNKSLDSMGVLLPFSSPIEYRDYIKKILVLANQKKLGGIPNPMLAQKRPEEMIEDAEEKSKIFLKNFKISPTQVIFVKNALRNLAERGVPVVVYWPVSTREYFAKAQEYKITTEVQRPLQALIDDINANHPESHIRLYDPNPDERLQCRSFFDSHHLSGACFPELSRLIVENLPGELRK
ncbi:MAG: DUF1574 domain-containing protein [bacterium]|nr:DUF1574 domain-containing protein [bacterium]